MNDLVTQRLIASVESLNATMQSMQHSLEAVLAKESPDNRMVTAPALAKAIGLDASTCRRKMLSGEWPSEGEGRSRRANIAVIKQLRRNEVLAENY